MKISSFSVDEQMRLGDRLRTARSNSRLTQCALAAEIGVTASAVAQWEHPGGTCPGVHRLRQVAAATSVQFEWLATGKGDMRRSARGKIEGESALRLDEFAQDHNEEMLLRRFRTLSPQAKQAIGQLLEQMKSRRR